MGEVARTMTELARAGKKALVPFVTAGFPTPAIFPQLLIEVSQMADVVEIGVPFSDPLADGPVIQHASQVALAQGMTLPWLLEMLADQTLRDHLASPIVMMSYLNPFFRLNPEKVFLAAQDAGVAGLILPDLPLEEGDEFDSLAHRHRLDLIYLIAPTTGDERARRIAARSRGFVYLVSITGVTGARDEFPPDTITFLQRMRTLTTKPLCVGFGISQPRQVRQLAPFVDGVIVGSSLLRAIGEAPSDPIEAARHFLGDLKEALGN